MSTTPTVVWSDSVSSWPDVSAIVRPSQEGPYWECVMVTRLRVDEDTFHEVMVGGAFVGTMSVRDLDGFWQSVLRALVDEVEGLDA